MKEIRKKLSVLLADIANAAEAAGKAVPFSYKGNDAVITDITADSRKVKDGSIFVCVKGKNFDGHTAAQEAVINGAAAIVCKRDIGLGDIQIIVPDTRIFMGLITAAFYDHPEQKLILTGITGTNGKTTTATMIHHILTFAGAKAGLISTAETLIGKERVTRDENTPTTPSVTELYALFAEMVEKGCRYCVMEVSSFALDQNRIGPAVFTCGVFTNLTRDHLDYHGTMEEYYAAKKKLFVNRCRLAFINTEDQYGRMLYSEIKCSKFSYGIKGGTSIYGGFIKYYNGASHFRFCFPGKAFPFTLHMMGSYNIANAVAAIGVCSQLKVPMDKITDAVNSFPGVRGRCEMIPTHRNFFIVCDYAHSPDALENMLPAIKKNTEGRLICLFGCGGDRDKTKRPLMAAAAAKYADYLIVTSDNPRNEDPDSIIDDILTGLQGTHVPYERITDRRSAIFHAVKIAKKGDVIVLAGKGHEDYQVLKGNTHIHFDEREICAEALAALHDSIPDIDTELYNGMSIDEICSAAGGKMHGISAARRTLNIKNISSDTRTIEAGSLFIAFKGDTFDGHNYVQTAIDKGAVAAVTNRAVGDHPCIVVHDTREAILAIASHYRNKFTPRIVGITGSVGKTTTKEMTALALSSRYNTLKTEGNKNNEIGMSFSLLRLTPDHRAAVIEMGMNHFGEIDRLSRACHPSIAVITNIGWSHVENLGSREGILKAKLEILAGLDDDAPLIVNGDDDMLFPLKENLKGRRVITCGVNNQDCDFTAGNISSDSENVRFTVFEKGEPKAEIAFGCPGRHHIIDALLSVAAAREADCDYEGIAEKLSEFRLDGLRQHIEKINGQTVIVDCYNAAPASMMAAIDVLADIPVAAGNKRVAVLGDMLELGISSPELHEQVGRYAARKKIDLIVCVGDYAKFMANAAEKEGAVCCTATSQEDAVNFLNFKLKSGDAVLFKASRGIHMEKILNRVYKRSST